MHVGYQFWKRLGLERDSPRLGVLSRAVQLTCAMTLNRLVHPASEHAMPALDSFHRLGRHFGSGFRDALRRRVVPQSRSAVSQPRGDRGGAWCSASGACSTSSPTVFFYDLTSTYFEGQALANPKAKRGYSRDKRPDCKQVVVGLVIGREGFPLAHEIFAGNVQDRQTLGHDAGPACRRGWGCRRGPRWSWTGAWRMPRISQEIRDRKLHYVRCRAATGAGPVAGRF